jgi:hypothetical protein
MKETILFLIGTFFLTNLSLAGEIKLKVKHDHGLGNCQGTLTFGENTVAYETANKKHSRIWKYQDIQQIGLLGPKTLAILTYEDRKIELGKDRTFNFNVLEGIVNESLLAFLETRVTRPLVSGIMPAGLPAKFSIPVKHLKGWGGTQGTLEITDEYIAYQSTIRDDSRIWRYENINSIGSTGSFELRLTTMERVHGEHGSLKDFVFDLKERLKEEAYDFIWWKVNGSKISASWR